MIKVLDKKIADKIAAGEVVERPLSIVKELVENSIDAGATNIVCEIKNGGKSYIRVTDNGCGIAPDECETAFLRHATSKISNEKDLEAILTLGFRGEALASICAVSRTELLTKIKENKVGKKVEIYGGDIIDSSMYGCPDGTTIIVRDLFYNTPARLKFLKSDSAESSAIIEFITNIALAYPNIRVRMINNGKILFATNGKGNRLNTIATLTSKIFTDCLVPFVFEEKGINVEGYVSGPSESRKNRKNQIFFVNGRVIDSKVIEKGINEAYSDRLFEGRFPICYLFLNIAPETMDVNIHPNKREVRFYDERVISETVRNGIISALDSKMAVPEIKVSDKSLKIQDIKTGFVNYNKEITTTDEKINQENNNIKSIDLNIKSDIVNEEISIINDFKVEDGLVDEKSGNVIEGIQENVDIDDILKNYSKEKDREIEKESILSFDEPTEYNSKKIIIEEKKLPTVFDFTKLEIHGQFFNSYIQLSDESGIYFVDQHAAHERVYFEKILNQYYNEEKYKQQILLPILINVSHSDKEREEEWLDILKKMGFSIEEFGPLSYKITEIPMFFELSEAENFLNEYIDSIGDYNSFKDNRTLDKIATKACKAAVKANDVLKDEEIKRLLEDMSKCKNPYSCPHGRPVFIKITKEDMEKRFKRR